MHRYLTALTSQVNFSERKVYTAEFKREAVHLAKERGSLTQTAQDLGLNDNTLYGWKASSKRLLRTLSQATGGRTQRLRDLRVPALRSG